MIVKIYDSESEGQRAFASPKKRKVKVKPWDILTHRTHPNNEIEYV